MKKIVFYAIMTVSFALVSSGVIDLNNFYNYESQEIPIYITKDNTPADNQITNAGATLGRVLFYDKKLSTTNTISCGSCHIQEHAFSDMANVSVGINGNLTPKHSMRLVNIRFSNDPRVRWDKSAESVEEQMTLPVKDGGEMGYSGENGQPSFDDLITKLEDVSYYPSLFTAAFGDADITEDRIQKALAQFCRSIQSFDAKYDIGRAQVQNDLEDFPNFTDDENEGKRLFIQDFEWEVGQHTVQDVPGDPGGTFNVAKRINGGFNCATCHIPPEFNIDPNSLNNAFVRPASNNPNAPSDISNTRVHTLRDLIKADKETLNGGMFHSGQAHFLEDIFGHYEFRRLDQEDNPNLDPRLMREHPTTGEKMALLMNSTRSERQKINAFLATLTGSDVYTNEKWSDPFDENGEITIMNTDLSVTEVANEQLQIGIYPNPTTNLIRINTESEIVEIQVYDTYGKLLQTLVPKEKIEEVSLADYDSGIYFLKFTFNNTDRFSMQKVIKL